MRSVGGKPEPRPDGEPTIDEIVQKVEERMVIKRQGSPEQGCFGCAIGIGILLFALLVWIFAYWYYNPEFHEQPHPIPAIFDSQPTPKKHTTNHPTSHPKNDLKVSNP